MGDTMDKNCPKGARRGKFYSNVFIVSLWMVFHEEN